MTVPFWDLDAALTEMHRGSAARGHRGVVFPARMEDFNLPPLAHPHWDPFWSEAQEMDLSINFHIGSGNIPMFGTDNSGKHLNYAWTGSMLFIPERERHHVVDLRWRVPALPGLKFVSVESGVGWVPFLLEAMDWHFHNTGRTSSIPSSSCCRASTSPARSTAASGSRRASARAAIEQLGADHVMFETDFPHPTGMTPGPASAALAPRDHLRVALAGMSDDTIRKVLHDNAAALYHLEA